MKVSMDNNSGTIALNMNGVANASPIRWALRHSWALVMGMVGFLYLLTHFVLPGKLNGIIIAHVIVPLMWLAIAAATYFLARREGQGNLVFTRKYVLVGGIVGGFQVAVLIVAGIFVGFGESPFAKNLPGMLINVSYIASMLVGMEFSRAFIVKSMDRRKLPLGIAFVVVMYAVLLIPPARYVGLHDSVLTMRFFGRFILPTLSDSILITYLAFIGGPFTAIAYRAVQTGFEWFSPVLPDLPWTAYLFIGTIPPMLGYMIVQGLTASSAAKAAKAKEENSTEKAGMFARILMAGVTGSFGMLLVAIILLNIGFMGFRSMVVISPSMAPEIGVGDLVITRAADTEELRVGDVVRYQKGSLNVVHRIVEIHPTAAGIELVTKGDANNTIDQPNPKAEAVIGRAIATVPKLGWVTIWFRQPHAGG